MTSGEARLDAVRRVLAVVAHPDDESFGLGAVLTTLVDMGVTTSVLCLTRGEASTLHEDAGDLGSIRAAEFERAAAILGVGRTELLGYPDLGLSAIALDQLAAHVRDAAQASGADALLVFDEGGITGHPDHSRATEAALAAADALNLAVFAWALPAEVACALNAEFSTTFRGREDADLALRLAVDRERQRRAIAEHRSQSAHNPVLWRRLELLGDGEWLRVLRESM